MLRECFACERSARENLSRQQSGQRLFAACAERGMSSARADLWAVTPAAFAAGAGGFCDGNGGLRAFEYFEIAEDEEFLGLGFH